MSRLPLVLFLDFVEFVSCLAHQVFPAVNIGVMASKANDKGLLCIDDAHIIAEFVIFTGFVGDRNLPTDLAIQLVINLLEQQSIDDFLADLEDW